jgi:murein tripeptide amidase MpaA
MDAGIHAREWMAPPVALYVAHQLTTAENRETLLELADWYILPVANPDGYVYSWDVVIKILHKNTLN